MDFKDVGFLRNYRQGCPLALPQTCVHVHLHTYEHIQTHMVGGERMHHMNLDWRDTFEDSLSMWLQLRWVLLFIYLFTHLFFSFFYLFYSLFLWVYAWCGREGPGYISYTWRPEDNCEIRSLPFPEFHGSNPDCQACMTNIFTRWPVSLAQNSFFPQSVAFIKTTWQRRLSARSKITRKKYLKNKT